MNCMYCLVLEETIEFSSAASGGWSSAVLMSMPDASLLTSESPMPSAGVHIRSKTSSGYLAYSGWCNNNNVKHQINGHSCIVFFIHRNRRQYQRIYNNSFIIYSINWIRSPYTFMYDLIHFYFWKYTIQQIKVIHPNII